MTVSASRYCDGCDARVATKSIFWHTVKDYVTIRGDDVPTYVNYEDATTPVKLHYCRRCWNIITKNIPFKNEVVTPYDVR